MSELSEKIRRDFKAADDIRDAGLMTPNDIKRYDDIVYGENEKWQVLDVYRPLSAEGKLPVIVSVHGGGWVYGDKERYQYYCMSLAQRGFAVVNFTYRLAPDFQYPSSMEDTNLVFAWILEHQEEYGFDAEHVFAVGDSAGAHMLALYSAICTNADYAKTYPFQVPEGFCPTAIALNCGTFEMQKRGGEGDNTVGLMYDLLPEHGSEAELKWISPFNYVTEKFPPTFIMTCTGDFLLPQGPVAAKVLAEHSVPFEFHFYGDAEHTLGHVFHVNIRLEEAKRCNDETCAFFRKYCK